MTDKIAEHLDRIQIHAEAMLGIPANEQHMGHMQIAVYVALAEIKECLTEIVRDMEANRESLP